MRLTTFSEKYMLLTHSMPLISFDTPWRHFRGYQKRSVAWNGLMTNENNTITFSSEAAAVATVTAAV